MIVDRTHTPIPHNSHIYRTYTPLYTTDGEFNCEYELALRICDFPFWQRGVSCTRFGPVFDILTGVKTTGGRLITDQFLYREHIGLLMFLSTGDFVCTPFECTSIPVPTLTHRGSTRVLGFRVFTIKTIHPTLCLRSQVQT
jgi:hypothetical protein